MAEIAQIDGVLEKRGLLKRWAQVYVRLTNGNVFSWYDVKNRAQEKDRFTLEHVEALASGRPGEEHAFQVHFTTQKGHEKWVLRTRTTEDFHRWTSTLRNNLDELGSGDAYSYGLPPNDPRTDLPLISVPKEYQANFGYLNMAVIHWFGPVKKLGVGFSVEERIAVLGERCLYLCKKNADITRCVMITDIKSLLLAQDDAKDLYIAIIMPAEIPNKAEPDRPARPEYDLMFHSPDIQTFVRYLRTVYVYQTQGPNGEPGKNLPLEQVRDKAQLSTDVNLVRPKGWELMYWQPMFKEHLAQLLAKWYQQGGAEELAADTPAAPPHRPPPNGGTPLTPPDAPTAAAAAAKPPSPPPGGVRISSPTEGLIALDDSDPLGKLLVVLGLARYYQCMSQKKMTLELMTCGLIDDSDLYHFGIESEADRCTIISALQDKELIDRLMSGDPVKTYKPSPASQSPRHRNTTARDLADDFAGAKPALALDDDLELDLDDIPAEPAPGSPRGLGGGGGDLDLDLGDFGALSPAKGAAIGVDFDDDLDLDLGSPAGAKEGGAGDDASLGLDLSPAGSPKAAGPPIELDDDL